MEIIELLFQQYPVISLFLGVAILIFIIILVWSVLVQGREFQLWHLKIGTNTNAKKSFKRASYSIERQDYYKSYYRMIAEAKFIVKAVGDGFACHGKDNISDAAGLVKAMRTATRNGVVVKRFQFARTLSLQWLDMLIDLQREAGDKFQLYMNHNLDPGGIPYVICVTDENCKVGAEINVMFTKRADTALKQKKAGPALLATNQDIATAMSFVIQDHFIDENLLTLSDLMTYRENMRSYLSSKVKELLSDGRHVALDETSIIRAANSIGTLDVEAVRAMIIEELNKRGAPA